MKMRIAVSLALIFILAFALRLCGIGFGLPDFFHADEPTAINMAMAMGQGDLNPHAFWKPALLYYLIFIQFGIYYIFGFLTGVFKNTTDFVSLFLNNPTSFYLIARISMGAVCGAVSIFPMYLLGKKVFSKNVGIICAFFLAINFLHVRNSHYAWHDIPMTLMILLSLLWIYRIYDRAAIKDYLLCGTMIAVATAFKYNAILLVVPVFVAHFFHGAEKRTPPAKIIFDIRLIYGGLTLVLVFLLLNPFLLLDIKSFIKTFHAQAATVGYNGSLHHLKYSMLGSMGMIQLCLGFLGIAIALRMKMIKAVVSISFLLVFYLSVTFCGQMHERYVIPMVPVWLMFSAFACERISGIFKAKKIALISIVSIAAVVSLAKSCYLDHLFTLPDTRTQAKEYVAANIKPGEKIAMVDTFFSPRLAPTIESIEKKKNYISGGDALAQARSKKIDLMLKLANKDVPRYRPYYLYGSASLSQDVFSAHPAISLDVKAMRKNRIKYVFVYKNCPEYRLEGKFYDDLPKYYYPIRVFNPFKTHNTGLDKAEFVSPTAAPFMNQDIFTRKSLGPVLILYERK